ncbi:hypothetical protein GIB67_043137 [Kingdonia uniflora]|uniref:SMC hinge domain-containing protein n=1 Tax=Kingdonia uniflora TaxID=39325 RepID=A0A7J7NJD2_9MAGN|nr:hypothetical protein GIB67_043137 [Kingdonia uniflora]
MYIKQIIIEGFKSYREQVATEPFSSKVNCVVGANGSGKTNFFHAIRFVLSDLFQNLRNEDRHALLHEGAGHQLLSAFVEIVFDNSDNRIPVDKEEVRLRRTIGLKKDEYFLDGKHITKTEVMNLLESAGFSRSNPYYVVQQGKIASLTLMKDSERLDLLKEIGGTRVYEERRRESLKIMQETGKRLIDENGNKRKQIIQVVQYLDERLKELDEEKEELKKYQQLDKQRRSLEYTIYDKELHDAKKTLDEVEGARTKVSEASTKMHNDVMDAHKKAKDLDKELKGFTKNVLVLDKEKEVTEKRRTEAMKKHAKLELDVRDLEEKISGNIKAKEEATRELEVLQTKIKEYRDELETIRSSYNDQMAKEEEITKGIMDREKKLSILYQKQGRATQFSNKAARDKWLQKEIADLQRVLSSNLEQEKRLQDEIQEMKSGMQKQAAYLENLRAKLGKKEARISKYRDSFYSLKKHKDELQDERKSLWGKESDLSNKIDKFKADVGKAEKALDHATPGFSLMYTSQDIRRGLNSVRRLCKAHNICGVYGPILELFECEEPFFTPVEVTAGNSLFHVVVETDEISTRIIRYLNSEKGGRVTFIPLNRVKAPHVSYPHSSDVVPLLKKLTFSSHYNAAFQQVFGRTVICRDLDVATKVARTNGLDCITLEGDQVSKKGGMTGGFYDIRRSRLKFIFTIKNSIGSIKEKEKEMEGIKTDLENILITLIDQKITKLISEEQKVQAEQSHKRAKLDQVKQDISNANKQETSIVKALEKKEKLLSNTRTQIEQLKASIAMKRDEMNTDLIDHLSGEEKTLLSHLHPEITELKEKLIACKTDRIETETRKGEIETNLSANLVRRQQELEAIKYSAEADLLPEDVDLRRQELADAKACVDDTTKQLRKVSTRVDEIMKQMKSIKDDKDKLKALEDKYERILQDEAKQFEELLSKKSTLIAKQENCMKKIRDLGSLPSDAFEM